jgi:hypothetical protein
MHTLQGNAGGPNTGPDVAAVSINQDREAYALAAGFALGLINLGRGRWSSGISNGSIAETLKRLILGGAWGMPSSWSVHNLAMSSCQYDTNAVNFAWKWCIFLRAGMWA